MTIFAFSIKGDRNLIKTVEAFREIRQDLGSIVGGVNFMNKERTDAMKDIKFQGAFRGKGEFEWQVLGGLYGTKEIVNAAKKDIKRRLRKKSIAKHVVFLGPENIGLVRLLQKLFSSISLTKKIGKFLEQGILGYEVCSGQPNQVAIPLAYIGIDQVPDKSKILNPAIDGCGLFWFAPLFPAKGEIANTFANNVKDICVKHGVVPLITLTSVNHSCFDSTIPILFDPKDEANFKNAKACYDELMSMSESMGILPYRLSSTKMREFYEKHENLGVNKFVKTLKKSIDENETVSPLRYYK